MTLREIVADAQKKKIAIGHFNISDSNQLNGIAAAARELQLPIIIGVSEGEREFLGLKQTVALTRAAAAEFGIPVFVNADHTYSADGCKAAVDAGFDAVIYDGAKLSDEENATHAKEVVAYARQSGRDVLVEAELGYIGTSSKVLDAIPEGAGLNMTTPEQAEAFVRETGIDLLAPSVGNIHGMLKNVPEPRLDIPRIESVAKSAGVPLVLHGGSGTSDEDFKAAIKAGIAIVHINTEIRVAYRKGLEEALAADKDEVAPYKYLAAGRDAVQKVVKERLSLFSGR
jgi:fructose-bisphosphate aldolase class II